VGPSFFDFYNPQSRLRSTAPLKKERCGGFGFFLWIVFIASPAGAYFLLPGQKVSKNPSSRQGNNK